MIQYHFTFHDYGGLENQDTIGKVEDNHFIYKYNFEDYCYEQDINRIDPFDVLKRVKKSLVISKNSEIINISRNGDTGDYSGIYPYSLLANKTIKTSNYVGVLKYKASDVEATIEIGSRFDKENPSQLFLSYLMSKSFDGQHLPEYPPEINNQNMWELLLCFIFSNQVKEAYRQGLFKAYKRFEYNDCKLKGVVDVNRHLKLNLPYVGNIAYGIREQTHDVPVLHLILHTFDLLEKKYPEIMESLNRNDSEGIKLECIKRTLKEVATTFNSRNVQNILSATNNRIAHPYFNKYEPLRKTCRMILRDMGLSIYDGNQEEQVYGVLIDMNWLWENFIGKEVMGKLGFNHVIDNKTPLLVPYEDKDKIGKKAVKFREYDFIKEKVMIADAKYKPKWQEEKWSELSNDVYQVMSYMLVAGVKKGAVVFPEKIVSNKSKGISKYHIWTDHSKSNIYDDNVDPYSQGYYFYTIPLMIPKITSSADTFKVEIENVVNNLIKNLELEGI